MNFSNLSYPTFAESEHITGAATAHNSAIQYHAVQPGVQAASGVGTLLGLPLSNITLSGHIEETTGKATLDLVEAAKKIFAGQFHLDPPAPAPDPLPPTLQDWPIPGPPLDPPSPPGDYPEPSGGSGGDGAGDGGGLDPDGTDGHEDLV